MTVLPRFYNTFFELFLSVTMNNDCNDSFDPFDALAFENTHPSSKQSKKTTTKKQQPAVDTFDELFADFSTSNNSSSNTQKQSTKQFIPHRPHNNITQTKTNPKFIFSMPFLDFDVENYLLNKVNTKSHNLYIDHNTTLRANKEYVYNNIYIKNCTLKIDARGILVLKSLNNIILDNATIDLKGKVSKSNRYEPNYDNCIHAGSPDEYDKVSVGRHGSDGDSCCGGGFGGNGLKIECNKLILWSSMISVRGTDTLHQCDWGCGPGYDGSVLLICNQIKLANNSTIDKNPRIVINCDDLKKYEIKKMCLLHGYMRRYAIGKSVIDLCNILNKYLMDHRGFERGNGLNWVRYIDLKEYKKKKEKQQKEKAFLTQQNAFFTGFGNNSTAVIPTPLLQKEPKKEKKSLKELMAGAYK
eukprot:19708_1